MNSAPGSFITGLVRRTIVPPQYEFSPEQQEAIAHRGTPLIVRGAPGTGKTTVLIESALARIAEGQDPNSILILTYGRERAAELRDEIALRAAAGSPGIMNEPIARTFHSLAFSILKMRENPDEPEPILMSGPEQDMIIRELLQGDIENGATYWHADLNDPKAPAIATRGFARELRDLILRAAERDISPKELAKLGAEQDEKYWQSCAHFWEQYLEILSIQEISAGDAKRKVDPSQIVIEAYYHLQNNSELADQLRMRFTTIMVDEFQESDPAQRLLLRELVGSDVLLCADEASAVGRFRGADPDKLSDELEFYLAKGKEITLLDNFRSSREIFSIATSLASQFSNEKYARAQRCAVEVSEAHKPPLIACLRTQSEEAHFIAYQFRRAHLIEGVPWSQMAVILRAPGAVATALRRAFGQAGIPVATEMEVLSSNPAIAPLILMAKVALHEESLTAQMCETLVLSEFGGADAVSLRRIRRALLMSREEGNLHTGAQLLIEAVKSGDVAIEGADSLLRIHDLLARARKVLRRKNAQGEDLLWEIWSNAVTSDGEKLSESWRRQALRGGARGAVADRDLDAIMQLFESARRFADRFPYSGPESFIRQITQENIAGDVITAKGQRPDVVEIVTVHSAKGREWEMVAIAGLQEGTWPNLRQRGSLLGSERLVERLRHGIVEHAQLDVFAANGLANDERRLIYVAATRAKSQLIVTSIRREDEEPSIYFEEVVEFVLGEKSRGELLTEVPRPLTTNALVATLRNELAGERAELSAALLARLAIEGVAVADTDNWYGVLPISSDAPIVAPGALVLVSPSSSESFSECGLKWFLERNGGTDGDSTAQVLGSAIHAFAAMMEQDSSLSEESLIEKLKSSWNLIDPNSGWVRNKQLTRAIEMIRKFVKYHQSSQNTIVGVEKKFEVVVGRARISGNVDRLEVTADGGLYVIDFKTGGTATSIPDAAENKQMQAYQLGIIEGGFSYLHPSTTSAGAELVFLGTSSKDATKRSQPPVDVESVRKEINEIAEGMGSGTFFATINKLCTHCAVRSSCPIQSDGQTVIG
ncbi:MAG: ATP-dependent helicase [Actinobacteria bacterium]|nr:ATP-dependent helicase [Actinomycetota bacterium]